MPHTGSPHTWLIVGPDARFRVPMYYHCALARIYPPVTAVYVVATYLFLIGIVLVNPLQTIER